MKIYLSALILAVLFFCGCQTIPVQVKAPLENEGEVYLYIRTFPQDSERLRFSIEGVFAVGDEGTEYPLSVRLSEFNVREINRQRLVAFGALPPGLYSGLSFKVKSAILQTSEGDAELLVPEKPVRIDFPFRVEKKRSMVISTQFRYAESIQGGFSFSPSFSMLIPERPLISLMGFVSNSGSNNVTVFDKNKMEVTGVISTGSGPKGMAISPDRARAFVALSGEDSIEAIDIAGGNVLNDIRLSAGDRPLEIALTPDGRILLSANSGSNTVSIIDAVSSIETSRVQVGDGPQSIAIDQTGRRAFVFNNTAGTISLIDIPLRAVAATIATEPHPIRGQFNRRGDRLYVISSGSPFLVILDPATLSVTRREFVGMKMNSLKVDTRTDLFYIGKKFDMDLAAYDPFSLVAVDYIRTDGAVDYMSIDGEGNYLFLVTPERGTVSAVNLVSRKTAAILDVGEIPYWVTMQGER